MTPKSATSCTTPEVASYRPAKTTKPRPPRTILTTRRAITSSELRLFITSARFPGSARALRADCRATTAGRHIAPDDEVEENYPPGDDEFAVEASVTPAPVEDGANWFPCIAPRDEPLPRHQRRHQIRSADLGSDPQRVRGRRGGIDSDRCLAPGATPLALTRASEHRAEKYHRRRVRRLGADLLSRWSGPGVTVCVYRIVGAAYRPVCRPGPVRGPGGVPVKFRLVVGSLVLGVVVAMTGWAPAGAAPAPGVTVGTEPATSFWAMTGEAGAPRGVTVSAAPSETFAVSGGEVSAHNYGLTATMGGAVEGGVAVYSSTPLTPGSYSLAGNTHFSFSYDENYLQTGPQGLTGVVRILRANFSRVDGLPAAELAMTYSIRVPGSPQPVYGSLGIDTTLPLALPGETAKEPLGDFNGDGTTDVAVFRPATGRWYIRGYASISYGRAGDIPVPGDYNGDGSSDIAVFRPSTGRWYIRGNASIIYGRAGDIPVPGDYNGDGKTDIAVYRPSTGEWFIRGIEHVAYGKAGDKPIQSDYNGDGSTDIAVYRPSTRQWFIRGQEDVVYGAAGDIPEPSNWPWVGFPSAEPPYDNDGQSRIAVFHPGTGQWQVQNDGTINWGAVGDIPVPGDYTAGVGNLYQAAAALFRPSTGKWYLDNPYGQVIITYGQRGDIPV